MNYQIHGYHSSNNWLLWATISNHGQLMMDFVVHKLSCTSNEAKDLKMAQTSNSLLSEINRLVARDNNWQPRVTIDGSSMFILNLSFTSKNYVSNSNIKCLISIDCHLK